MSIPDILEMDNGERLAVYWGGIYVPPGSQIELSGNCDVGNLVNAGKVIIRDDARVEFSNILNLEDSEFYAGTPERPISCELVHYPTPYLRNDPTKRGNSFIGVGNARIELYGRVPEQRVFYHPQEVEEQWPSDTHVEFYRDSNGVEWYVNFSRGIKFSREAKGNLIRPHLMLMHMTTVPSVFQGVELDGWGLSDKSKLLHTTDNPIGGYAYHAHRCGEDVQHVVEDSSSHGSPGWGFTNHSSNVAFRRCVSSAFGAAYSMEAGDELGEVMDCIAINCMSDQFPTPADRTNNTAGGAKGDLGAAGEGLWSQAPLVEVDDFLAINCGVGVFFFFDGLFESVNDWKPQTYESGIRVDRTSPVDIGKVTIIDPRRVGLWTRWAANKRRIGPLRITGAQTVGITREYDAGMIIENAVITGHGYAGVEYTNQAPITRGNVPVMASWKGCRISGFQFGFYSPMDNRIFFTDKIEDCRITATRAGFKRAASMKNPRGTNGLNLTNTTINAPVDIELLPPERDPDRYLGGNECTVDGNEIPWPGID